MLESDLSAKATGTYELDAKEHKKIKNI